MRKSKLMSIKEEGGPKMPPQENDYKNPTGFMPVQSDRKTQIIKPQMTQ